MDVFTSHIQKKCFLETPWISFTLIFTSHYVTDSWKQIEQQKLHFGLSKIISNLHACLHILKVIYNWSAFIY